MRANGLYEHAGGVGGNAEGGGERLLSRGVHNRRAAGGAGILDPPAHRAAIDWAAVAREAVLDPEQWHALAVLEHDDVREQGRRGERAGEGLRRHRRGVDRGLAVVTDDLVLDPREDDAPHAAPLVGELAALLGGDAHRLAFKHELLVERIDNLDALLLERQLLEIAPAGGPLFSILLVVALVVGRVRRLARERVELAKLLGELDLELRGVDALGFRNEDAALQELELFAQPRVRGTELVALFGHGRELRLELDDARCECRVRRRRRRRRRLLAHRASMDIHPRSRCRSPRRRNSTCRQCTRVGRRGATFTSTSMPSSRSSSMRSSIAMLVASPGASGSRKVDLSRRL